MNVGFHNFCRGLPKSKWLRDFSFSTVLSKIFICTLFPLIIFFIMHHLHRYQNYLNYLHHFRLFHHFFCCSRSVLIHDSSTLNKYSAYSSFRLNYKITLWRFLENYIVLIASLIWTPRKQDGVFADFINKMYYLRALINL